MEREMEVIGAALALGDSIALGTGQALHILTIATVGMGSCAIAQRVPSAHFSEVVISAGVNDPPGRCVASIRDKLSADHVVWIRPINAAGPTVDRVAAAHGDRVITYTTGRDHLHPASYTAVAASVRAAWPPA
jgi:hypothetical protein